MPIPSGDSGWITLAEAKAALNITTAANDDEVQDTIDAACALLENHPGYTVAEQVRATSHTERPTPYFDDGRWKIILRHGSVVLSSVEITEWNGGVSQALAYEPFDAGPFTANGWDSDDGTGANGILYRTSSGSASVWAGDVKVTYTAGTGDVPADIRQAALVLIEHLWETQRGGQGPTLPRGLDVGEPQFEAQVASFAIPRRVEEMLTAYHRAPAVA